MNAAAWTAFGLCIANALGACASESRVRAPLDTSPPALASPVATTPVTRTSETERALCIQPGELDMEPLDLEWLDDEADPVELSEVASASLDRLAVKSNPVQLGADASSGVVLSALRCRAGACRLGVLTVGANGEWTDGAVLPGLNAIAEGTLVSLVSVRADVNSDARADLWISYDIGDAASTPSSRHVAAFSLPELALQWHQVVSTTSPVGAEMGCDGALYPVDADCDGDGDIVLIKRCGPMRCLNDDNADCKPPREQIAVFVWDAASARYRARE